MRAARALGWTLAAALLAAAVARAPRRPARTPLALLGPFAELGADLQWVRFQAAVQRGEEARALGIAESALALAPRGSGGWERLAGHLAYDLASREREPDLARRRAWFEAGLDVLARGAQEAAGPAELLVFRAVLLATKADTDPELSDGGARALLAAAAEAFDAAAALGDPHAAELAAQLRAAIGRGE